MQRRQIIASPTVSVSARNLDNFVAIRLVAAILVMFGHSFPLTGGYGPGYLGNSVSTLSVKVFFVISGYLISESWSRDPHFGRYLLRRALRIFPALIVLCVLTVFIVGPVLTDLTPSEYFSSDATWRYFSNVALLPVFALPGVFQDNIYQGAVNGSIWTLPVEFSMYLLMPLVLVLPGRRVMSVVMAVGLSIASIWFTRFNIPDNPAVFWGTNLITGLELVPYFFWGAVYRIWINPRRLNLQIAVAMILLLPLLAIDNWPRSEVVALVIIPYLTLTLGHAAPPLFAGVERWGDWSYGVYLYGFLVQQIVANYFPTSGNSWMNLLFSVPPTLLLGMLSWRFIEEPVLRLKPRATR
jgi:peptidoglycan/LPS O-acetylase OafA/YrhL